MRSYNEINARGTTTKSFVINDDTAKLHNNKINYYLRVINNGY